MKKTLVALAVLAASGASFAQVTMTGEFTWGYKATSITPSATADAAGKSGFGVDYSNINFAVTEDLGGGTKASVLMGIDGADRSNDGGSAVAGQNANITLTNGASKLVLATAQNNDYLSEGIAGLGNPVWISQDDHVFSKHTHSDSITYSYNLGAITLGYQFLEQGNNADTGATRGLGEGAGISGDASDVGQPRNLIQATYAAGPLTANVGLGVYSNQTDNSGTAKSLARFAVAYDLGMAKLGLAYSNKQLNLGSQVDTFLAAAVPLGALTLGVDWAQRKDDDGTTSGTKAGYGIGAAYALSKRTQLVANYRNWEAQAGATNKSTDTRMYIDHSF